MVRPTTAPAAPVAGPAVTVEGGPPGGGVGEHMRRVSWGAIFAGTAIAMALMVFFTTLGLGIGAASVDPLYDQNPLSGIGVGGAIYLIVTQLISLFVGGWVASRLAGVPRELPALIHGAAVWALSTLVLAWLAMSGAGAAFGAAGTILSNSAQAAVSAGRAVLPEDLSLPSPGQVASGVSMEDLPPEVRSALREQGLTIEQVREEARGALRDVVSRQEQQAAVQEAQETAASAVRSPGDLPQDVNRLIDDLFGGQGAVLSEEDRQEALATLEERLGVSPEEAEAFLATAEERAQEAAAQVEQSVEAARQQATEAAQAASAAVSRAALALSLASILGLIAALGGGHVGRPDDLVGDRPADRA